MKKAFTYHAMDRAFTPSGTFPSAPQTVSYTGFDKVLKVVEGNDSVVFAYGHDRQRISMEEHVGNTVRTKRYVGNCELVSESSGLLSTERWLTYLTGPTGVYAVVETSGSTNTLHYVLKDNLGSWTTITDSDGNVEQRLSYDAWGNLRNPETWSGSFTSTPMFDRGFTGHEHLYDFGLINMKFTLSERSAKLCLSTAERSELGEANGRMYDPVMSCFLSPDNYMQCPDISQNFNRYAYCLNNPLRYTDPSGEVFGLDDMASFLIMTGVAVTMTVTQNGIGNTLHGRPFFQNAGQPAAMALIQSGFSFGIGEMAMGMGPGAFLFQIGAHATLDGTFTYFQGGDFWKGAATGVVSSLFSSLTNGLTANLDEFWRSVAIISSGALSGGVTSKIMGGDFIEGAINGFITAGLNHALHQIIGRITIYRLKNYQNYHHHLQTTSKGCKIALIRSYYQYYSGQDLGEAEFSSIVNGMIAVDQTVTLEECFKGCGLEVKDGMGVDIIDIGEHLSQGHLYSVVLKGEHMPTMKNIDHLVTLFEVFRENEGALQVSLYDPLYQTVQNYEWLTLIGDVKDAYFILGLKQR